MESDGGSIVFASTGGSSPVSLFEVSAEGGTPVEIITPADVGEAQIAASRPRFVPLDSSRILLFTVGDTTSSTMCVKNLVTGQTEILGFGDRPVYSASTGHLIYQSARNAYDLWARPFSLQTLQFTGAGFPLRQDARQPSLSEDDTLVYLDGSGGSFVLSFVWWDRSGKMVETVGLEQQQIQDPAFSPDGQRIAVSSIASGSSDIWIHDLTRSINTRLTFDAGMERGPTWSPSGREIAYWLTTGKGSRLMRKAADGTGFVNRK